MSYLKFFESSDSNPNSISNENKEKNLDKCKKRKTNTNNEEEYEIKKLNEQIKNLKFKLNNKNMKITNIIQSLEEISEIEKELETKYVSKMGIIENKDIDILSENLLFFFDAYLKKINFNAIENADFSKLKKILTDNSIYKKHCEINEEFKEKFETEIRCRKKQNILMKEIIKKDICPPENSFMIVNIHNLGAENKEKITIHIIANSKSYEMLKEYFLIFEKKIGKYDMTKNIILDENKQNDPNQLSDKDQLELLGEVEYKKLNKKNLDKADVIVCAISNNHVFEWKRNNIIEELEKSKVPYRAYKLLKYKSKNNLENNNDNDNKNSFKN